MAETLESVRERYPQYQGVPDNVLADRLYSKFYAGKIDRVEFDKKIGLTEPTAGELTGRAVDKVVGAVSSAAGAVKDIWTGDTRREFDYPELPSDIGGQVVKGQGAPTQKMALARTDLGKLNIFMRMRKPEDHGLDKFGNAWVQVEGNRYYLNRPGASMQDVNDLAAMATIEGFAGRYGGKAGQAVAGTVGRVVGTGAGLAAGSYAQDIAAHSAGSGQGLDHMSALISATFGATGEAMAPIIGPWFRKFFKKGEFLDDAGRLTPEAKAAMKRAGLDPNAITDDVAREMNKLAREATSPDDVVRSAKAAEAATEKVRLSKGDITGDPTQQSREMAMEAGARGEAAQKTMTAFRQQQADDIAAARANRLAKMGDSSTPLITEPGGSMDTVRETVTTARAADKASYKVAKDLALEAKASLSAEGVRELSSAVRKEIASEFDVQTMPAVKNILSDMQKWEDWKGLRGVSMKAIDTFRKRISNGISRNADQPADVALMRIKDRLNAYMETAVERALVNGDDEAIELFKRSHEMYREFKKKFDGDKIVDAIMQKNRQTGELEMSPRDAANYLFGQSVLGNKQGARNALDKLKGIVGEESADWSLLKQEGFLRLFPEGPKGVSQFKQNFDAAMKKAPDFMRELYGDSLPDLMKLRRVIGYATERSPQAGNPSKTGYEIARSVRDVFGPAGRVVSVFLSRFGGPFADAKAAMEAVEAAAPKVLDKTPVPGIGLWGATAATGAGASRPQAKPQ